MRKNVAGLVRTTIISRTVIELVRTLGLVKTFGLVRTTIILRIAIGPHLLRIVLFIFHQPANTIKLTRHIYIFRSPFFEENLVGSTEGYMQ